MTSDNEMSIAMNMFIYLLLISIGYVALIKTENLSFLRNYYFALMCMGFIGSILFLKLSNTKKRAVYLLLFHLFSLLPTVLFSLILMCIALSRLTNLNHMVVIFAVLIYVLLSFAYYFSFSAPFIFKNNIKINKFNFREGVFNPQVVNNHSSNHYINSNLFVFLAMVITFILSVIRYKADIYNFKFWFLGLLSLILSYVFLKLICEGFIYPIYKILFWEFENKKYMRF